MKTAAEWVEHLIETAETAPVMLDALAVCVEQIRAEARQGQMVWTPTGENPAPIHHGDMVVMCSDGFWYAGHWEPDREWWETLDGIPFEPGAIIAYLDIEPYSTQPLGALLAGGGEAEQVAHE